MDNIIEKSENLLIKIKNIFLMIKNNCSAYPKINGTKNGEKKLKDIFNYLVSKNKDPKNIIWPQYINDAIRHKDNIKNSDISFINDKIKAKEIKKRGRNSESVEYNNSKWINVRNLKTQFKISKSKYKLTNDGKGLKYKTKFQIYNEKTNLKEATIEYCYVSKNVELNEKLFEFHCNEKDLINNFKNNKINFYGLQTIIQQYVKNCQYVFKIYKQYIIKTQLNL